MEQTIKNIKNNSDDIFKALDIYLDCNGSKECRACPGKTNGVLEFPKKTKRIVVFGDVHGDLDMLLTMFLKSQVINSDSEWIGKDTIVVQMGDILDRGGRSDSVDTDENNKCEELQIIQYIEFINKKAQKHGGKVLCLVGNHELMNLLGDFRYTSINTNKCFKDKRQEYFTPGSELCHKLACISYGILKINDWVFVHGGILSKHIESYGTNPNDFIKDVNELTQQIIKGEKNIQSLTEYEKKLLLSEEGIFWTRQLNTDCQKVKNSYDILQLNKGGIVVGHTPMNEITSKCDNNYWMVDTGASKAFGNKQKEIQILEIIKNGDEYEKNII